VFASSPGRLAENVMHFGRVLRSAGLPVGSDRVMVALQALQHAGLERREDFHAVLAACLLDRHEHAELFDQAFALFWRDPELMRRMRALPMPRGAAEAAPPARENRRLADALFPGGRPPLAPEPDEAAPDPLMSWSDRERLRRADFGAMTTDEFRRARRLMGELRLVFEPLRTRRMEAAHRAGRPDWRATLRDMGRHGGELAAPRWRRPRTQPAPLVLLADISGSMARYSRALLHFAHLLGQAPPRVESFVFGTRLTRTTRWLRHRDPDVAVARVTREVADWSGGTRIAECLQQFNRQWARRVLPGGATVLLVSDGLEHGDRETLAFEMVRLHKSCRRLVWLNPLLRYHGFEPKAAGIRAMLPHVDALLPVHNLESLEQLVAVLAGTGAAARA
jgi:uncharacterized protein with von Willebrand factor type A (vWA) domain